MAEIHKCENGKWICILTDEEHAMLVVTVGASNGIAMAQKHRAAKHADLCWMPPTEMDDSTYSNRHLELFQDLKYSHLPEKDPRKR